MNDKSISPGLENRILKYSAVASVVLLGAGVSNAQHIGIDDNTTVKGSSYDIFFNGSKKFTITHSTDFSTTATSTGGGGTTTLVFTYYTVKILRATNNAYVVKTGVDIAALDSSNSVSSGNNWMLDGILVSQNKEGNFKGQGDKYIGVKFSDNGTTKYGWIKINIPSNVYNVEIINHVYEDSGNKIHIDGTLPVELVSFTAVQIDEKVKLSWETASEINNFGFEIERKRANVENNWEKIGFVEGAGNSNSPKFYEFFDETSLASEEYFYRLKQIDSDGRFKYSEKIKITVGVPEKFELKQNYPNPFNPTTTIKYSIPSVIAREWSDRSNLSNDSQNRQIATNLTSSNSRNDANVQLIVYDVLGRKVATLVNERQTPGNYTVQFDADGLSSGVYFYRLTVDNMVVSEKKMLLLK